MNPLLASLICGCGIAGLFYLDRDAKVHNSKALWLPVIWIWIIGSRPASAWLGISPPKGSNIQLDGSPFDAIVFALLSATAIAVLVRRGKATVPFLSANWPLAIYFFYCLISVAWSYHPDVAFKRWVKAIGDVAMVLVIFTDRNPIAAFGRLMSRVGFILLPTSLLLIKYYPNLGESWDVDGVLSHTGVTTNKNALGVILFVVSVCTLWRVTNLLSAKGQPNRRRHLIAHLALLGFGVWLLEMANSQTSLACFVLAGGLILATHLRVIRRRPARVHVVCLAIFLIGGCSLLFGGEQAAHALGRKGNFSGRTEIWAALIPSAPNAVTGAGFESYWISPNVITFRNAMSLVGWWHPEDLNEAHDGYLEVYLNLGCVGVGLIVWMLIDGYRRAARVFRLAPQVGSLMLAYIVAAAFYNITEAGFRMLNPMWVFLLMAVVGSNRVVAKRFTERAFDALRPQRRQRPKRLAPIESF